jgi:hypothetical protein
MIAQTGTNAHIAMLLAPVAVKRWTVSKKKGNTLVLIKIILKLVMS